MMTIISEIIAKWSKYGFSWTL